MRVREQISVLTHQLEEERKSNKKMRETVSQLNAIFESQDRQIEILRSDVVNDVFGMMSRLPYVIVSY